ncbi:hypothetical protein ACI2JA_03440 [Alkalihalobacillus sp. NPDC078783]
MKTIKCIDNNGLESRLLFGKEYKVLQEFHIGFAIIDEEGKHSTFSKTRFETK